MKDMDGSGGDRLEEDAVQRGSHSNSNTINNSIPNHQSRSHSSYRRLSTSNSNSNYNNNNTSNSNNNNNNSSDGQVLENNHHDRSAGHDEKDKDVSRQNGDDNNTSSSRHQLHRSSTEVSVGGTTIHSQDSNLGYSSATITPFERLSHDLSHNQRVIKEITLGRRIAFYRIRGEIGTGNFSQVKLGIHALTREKVAIKILDKTKLDQKTQRLLSREILSMERLHHPNIIRLYEVVETIAKLHIIMEYAGGGELFTKISNEGRLPEVDAKCIFAQLVAAIEHMHDNHIIHRDLKAENIFYATPKWIKIGDFGFSTLARSNETLNTFCGSPPYAAPELFKDEHYYGCFVDIWALGILLYFMVTGLMPFRAETVAKLKKCILDGSYTVPSYVSDSCVFLIRSILKHIPQDRFTMAEIKRSEWLEGQEFPGALEPYNLNPRLHENAGNEEEQTALHVLTNLGIKDEHLKQASIRDSRSSITGTYRIILHRVQKKNSGWNEGSQEPLDKDINHNERRSRRSTPQRNPRRNKPQSRTCQIL